MNGDQLRSLRRDVFVTLRYEGDVREAVLALKYSRDKTSARWIACHLAQVVIDTGVPVAVVTWIPTTSRRRRRRGFDHSQLIARHVARRLGVPVLALLRRRDRVAQTGLDRRHRLRAPQFVGRRPRSDGIIVVVDDVVTTGATMNSARSCLVSAGVAHENVMCVALAATPSP